MSGTSFGTSSEVGSELQSEMLVDVDQKSDLEAAENISTRLIRDTPREIVREVSSFITQSKYFTPAFNAAIFDGPIRIYFAQFQEAQALKLYFLFQERFAEIRNQNRSVFKDRSRNIFVMLYPTQETFEFSFGTAAQSAIVVENFGTDFVVGVSGSFESAQCDSVCAEVENILHTTDA